MDPLCLSTCSMTLADPNGPGSPQTVQLFCRPLSLNMQIFCVPVYEALDTRFLRLDEHEYSLQNAVRRLLMRGLFFSLSTLAAAMFPFIADFVGLVGSLAITPLTFVFPSMIFLKIHGAKCGKAERLWHAIIVILSGLMTLATTCAALRVVTLNSKTYHLFADT